MEITNEKNKIMKRSNWEWQNQFNSTDIDNIHKNMDIAKYVFKKRILFRVESFVRTKNQKKYNCLIFENETVMIESLRRITGRINCSFSIGHDAHSNIQKVLTYMLKTA